MIIVLIDFLGLLFYAENPVSYVVMGYKNKHRLE